MGLVSHGLWLDYVFVIDASPSMAPYMEEIKKWIVTCIEDNDRILKEEGCPVDSVRARLVTFKDIARYGDTAIQETPFFSFPVEHSAFAEAVNAIQTGNGYDSGPENAREAIYKAIASDWFEFDWNTHGRHIIFVITDALPYHLGERNGLLRNFTAENYPPNNEELAAAWQEKICSHSFSNEFILIAPDGTDAQGHSWEDVRAWQQMSGWNFDPKQPVPDDAAFSAILTILRSV